MTPLSVLVEEWLNEFAEYRRLGNRLAESEGRLEKEGLRVEELATAVADMRDLKTCYETRLRQADGAVDRLRAAMVSRRPGDSHCARGRT